MPRLLVIVVVVAVAAIVVDRLLLLAEARGLVYYRRKGASSASVGNALMAAMSIYEPGAQHLVEERRRADGDEAEDDEPLDGYGPVGTPEADGTEPST